MTRQGYQQFVRTRKKLTTHNLSWVAAKMSLIIYAPLCWVHKDRNAGVVRKLCHRKKSNWVLNRLFGVDVCTYCLVMCADLCELDCTCAQCHVLDLLASRSCFYQELRLIHYKMFVWLQVPASLNFLVLWIAICGLLHEVWFFQLQTCSNMKLLQTKPFLL